MKIILRMVFLFSALILACRFATAAATPGIVDAFFRPDQAFPQYNPLWGEGWSWKDDSGRSVQYAKPDMPLGGYFFIHVSNPVDKEFKITDVQIQDVSLKKAIVPPEGASPEKYPSSVRFSSLSDKDLKRLVQAGDPVWWRAEPETIPPGGTGQVVIRMRRTPDLELREISLSVVSNNVTVQKTISPGTLPPQILDISFSTKLDQATFYLNHPNGTRIPVKRILFDGKEVTEQCKWSADPDVSIIPVIVNFQPIAKGSYHSFQVFFGDGSSGIAGIRAWSEEFVYGMWGSRDLGNTVDECGKNLLTDFAKHGINVSMGMTNGRVREFLGSKEGQDYCDSVGFRCMTEAIGNARNPIYYFLLDEPDAQDYSQDVIKDYGLRLGSLGQWLVARYAMFREKAPDTMLLLNIDNTFKPENWYMYAQLADVCCCDPYMQEQLCLLTAKNPARLAYFTKPDYVLAVSQIAHSACTPKPLHLILNSVRHQGDGPAYRFATPEEKRLEVYYALGAGAKGLSYWWYSRDTRFYGCGNDDPDAVALYKEIAYLGAEARTAGPVLLRSSPLDLQAQKKSALTIRSLAAGLDTVAFFCVNENVASDRVGTVFTPLEAAEVKVKIPSWLTPADVFEIASDGIHDATSKFEAPNLNLNLGKTNLTRLIIATADASLRGQLDAIYKSKFEANVKSLKE